MSCRNSETLNYLWTTLVEDEERILRRIGSVMLQKTGLVIQTGGLRLKDAIEAFLRFTDKPMIASKEAVTSGLTEACSDGLIGIGRGPNVTNIQTRYCRQTISIDPNEDALWIIPSFEPVPSVTPSGETVTSPVIVAGGDISTEAATTITPEGTDIKK